MAAAEPPAGVGSVDPTKNVLDLVEAESKRQDGLRDAETRRMNDLASLRVYYEERISSIRNVTVGYGIAFLTLIITAMGIAVVWIK